MADQLPDLEGGANRRVESMPVLAIRPDGSPSVTTDPASDIIPIAPNDSADLSTVVREVRLKPISGTDGTIRVTFANGSTRDTEIAVGMPLTGTIVRVHATGTTATGLEGLV
ncbi:spike base protein, RCAP_Rcc01079 family [Stakelama pacifica]|uniref:Uncharacterized protein n=1 Tax=Stakelama pacifica TaxID=517720 RepID=A0A4R6FLG3_9SPHN|nr:hypothetical protein [Stakelama pacifica]TDN81770.1 hypothetical protein EV664_107172 [Stakelama pacifica]GGO96520.1 hypothetical protein GCM10011329_23240 [Stakelama pacifica]